MRREFSQLLILLVLILLGRVAAQTKSANLGFEDVDTGSKMPRDWVSWGPKERLWLDDNVRHGGKYSMRISVAADSAADGGACALAIPVTFEGTWASLHGYIKLSDVSEGFAGLMMRIDQDSTILQFDNMSSRNVQGTRDWEEYVVQLRIPEYATTIYVGGYLKGKGTVWFDDLRLLVDGKEYSEADQKKPYEAEHDKEFDNGSGITDVILSPQNVDNLATVGKVWGFLKYYHPRIAAGMSNWDYELFRVLTDVLRTTSAVERNVVLSRWIAKLGRVEGASPPVTVDSAKVKLYPDLRWTEDVATLGRSVVDRLQEIRYTARDGRHYYVGLAPGIGNPYFGNERSYGSMQFPDAGFRLLCLFRYWNIIQYYFPYRHLTGEEWDQVLRTFILVFVQAKNTLEYKLAALELVGRVHDTHANIRADKTLDSARGFNLAPLRISFVENKAVVVGYLNDTLGSQTSLKSGDVIQSVNGVPVEEIARARLRYAPASNYPTQLRLIANGLLRTNDSTLTLYVERAGGSHKTVVACYNPGILGVSTPYPPKDTCWSFLRKDIGYIYPGKIKNEYLPMIMSAFAQTKGIVIDMRCYPSSFIVFTLGRYLMPQPTPFVKFTSGDIRQPGLFTFGPTLRVGSSNQDYYRGKIVILINEVTMSQAEYTTMALRVAPRATVIGSTTSGADGDVSRIPLPGGISTMISGIGVYYPDGGETQRVGIVPDIQVRPTIKGIQEGKDELLEKAIEMIQNGT